MPLIGLGSSVDPVSWIVALQEMGKAEMDAFLTWLAVEHGVRLTVWLTLEA